MGGDGDALDNNEVIVFGACGCCYNGFLIGDGCLGCMSSGTICCLETEFCCKQGAPVLCLGCCAIRPVAPTTCIKAQAQMCCCVEVVGIPCDSEVPCMISYCGITCFPTFAVCAKLKDITGGTGGGDGGEAVGASG
mmetsp:Transcript_27909/g.56502  ORF Transcript_27909/g.56502 Transcript_27909/m.56502 type:complete len:136 (+) Transcript_27909:93-500(+)